MNAEDKKVEAMNYDEAQAELVNVPGWVLSENGNAIVKSYEFKNFAESLEFVNKVGKLGEEENHHPDFSFGWGYCHVVLMTHSIGGLHKQDFIMAGKINKIS